MRSQAPIISRLDGLPSCSKLKMTLGFGTKSPITTREGSVVIELNIRLLHSLKPVRVGSRRLSIGTASGRRNLCAGSS